MSPISITNQTVVIDALTLACRDYGLTPLNAQERFDYGTRESVILLSVWHEPCDERWDEIVADARTWAPRHTCWAHRAAGYLR